MFTFPIFDVEIVRKVDPGQLGWPGPREANDDSSLGCNRNYMDLRRRSWAEAERAFTLEQRLIARIQSALDPESEYESIEDELFENDEGLWGLDLGVASAVISLSAAKCLPFSSCNAGAFGGTHHETYPTVAFYTRPEMVELLIAAADEAAIGLDGNDYLVAYANDIRNMLAFAESIIRRRIEFGALGRQRSPRTKRNKNEDRQYDLPLD